jgi:HEAT repeat protein
MAESVAPTPSRRLPFWVMIIALVFCALAGVFVLLWFKLPTWAPAWVVEHSPWVDPIVRAVEDAQKNPRRGASSVMGEALLRIESMGEAARPGLLQALGSESRTTRTFVLHTLSSTVDEQLIVPLVQLLLLEARELEAEARKSGGSSRIAGQRQRFDPIYAVLLTQSHAALAEAILPLPTGSDLEAAVVFELAGKVADDRLVVALANILREPPGPWNEMVGAVYGGRAVMAADALLHSPVTAAIPALLPAFEDSSVRVRQVVVGAVRGLFKPVDFRLGQAMCRRLSDEDADVRRTAAKAMVFIEIPEAEEGLISLSQRADTRDREAAVFGLGSIHATQRAIDRLAECLADDVDEAVRASALNALVKTDNSAAIPPLLLALAAGTPRVRRETCFAITRTRWVHKTPVQEALVLAIDDPDDPTSEWAEKTLLNQSLSPELKSRAQLAVERQKPRRDQRASHR